MAMPAGTASTVANVADASASHRLFQNDCTKSGCSNTALNQRSENSVVGRVSVFSGVKATTHTTTRGASMKAMTRALNARARGPFLCMVRFPAGSSWSSQRLFVATFDQPVVAEHHHQVGHQQSQG